MSLIICRVSDCSDFGSTVLLIWHIIYSIYLHGKTTTIGQAILRFINTCGGSSQWRRGDAVNFLASHSGGSKTSQSCYVTLFLISIKIVSGHPIWIPAVFVVMQLTSSRSGGEIESLEHVIYSCHVKSLLPISPWPEIIDVSLLLPRNKKTKCSTKT